MASVLPITGRDSAHKLPLYAFSKLCLGNTLVRNLKLSLFHRMNDISQQALARDHNFSQLDEFEAQVMMMKR